MAEHTEQKTKTKAFQDYDHSVKFTMKSSEKLFDIVNIVEQIELQRPLPNHRRIIRLRMIRSFAKPGLLLVVVRFLAIIRSSS